MIDEDGEDEYMLPVGFVMNADQGLVVTSFITLQTGSVDIALTEDSDISVITGSSVGV